MRRLHFILAFLFFGSLAVSCASMQKGPTDDLAETVKKYYDLKMAARYEELWMMERMSVEKNETLRESNRKVYLSRIGGAGRLKGVEILKIGQEGSGTQGTTPVTMKLIQTWPPQLSSMPLPEGDHVLELQDLWEKIEGRWYHVRVGIDRLY